MYIYIYIYIYMCACYCNKDVMDPSEPSYRFPSRPPLQHPVGLGEAPDGFPPVQLGSDQCNDTG